VYEGRAGFAEDGVGRVAAVVECGEGGDVVGGAKARAAGVDGGDFGGVAAVWEKVGGEGGDDGFGAGEGISREYFV